MTLAPTNTVLVVDDDEAICFLFKMAIEQMGYAVFTAQDGDEGLKRLAAMPKPKLILLDLMMPVMDGWGFLAGVGARPEWRDIPVVACTAFNVHATDLNVKAVLSKPVDLVELSNTVHHWCRAGADAPPATGSHVE